MNFKYCLLLGCLLLGRNSILSVEPPKEPTVPSVELADKVDTPKKDSKRDKNTKSASVTVKLCDGRQVVEIGRASCRERV